MPKSKLLTADDLLAMGAEDRYELVKGVLVPMSPPPAPQHGYVASTIDYLVGSFVRPRRLGWTFGAETGFRLFRDPDTVRAADFSFVTRGRITRDMDLSRYVDLAPDLVVEVMSPSDSEAEVLAKVREFLDAGVRLVWVVYPRSKTVRVHRAGREPLVLGAMEELSGEDGLPGFTCPVAELFADPEADV